MSIDPEDIHRTALLHARDGSAATLADAVNKQAGTAVVIVADQATCEDVFGQAALLTAVATATRAFGTVYVSTAAPEARVQRGVHAGQTLAATITAEGAGIGNAFTVPHVPDTCPVVLVGAATGLPDYLSFLADVRGRPVLRASWRGWTAEVTPDPTTTVATDNTCILAAIAAAALAVGQAFEYLRLRPGSDAGYQSLKLDLWSLGARETVQPPPLTYAPHSWWLVGLGHLGQSYAWVISLLGYEGRSPCELVLQDVDVATGSTWSTGVLTSRTSNQLRKTRYVAAALEHAGIETRIVERRFLDDFRAHDAEPHVALLGVDNMPTRRLISNAKWKFAVDVGLGAGPDDYSSLTLRRFPGDLPSSDVAAWTDRDEPEGLPAVPAFQADNPGLDKCGLIEVAGKAVGVVFVGVAAACLAVADAVRELNGGLGSDVLSYDVVSNRLVAVASTADADIVGRPLRRAE